MSTVVVGDQPWVTEALQERRALGQDLYDEEWEGVYHVAPDAGNEHAQVCLEVSVALQSRARRLGLVGSGPFNLGTGPDPATGEKDFRVPDGGWFRERPRGTYAPTALVVLEVLSPSDETWEKFDFYLARGVQEILVAHPSERWIRCWRSVDGAWVESGGTVFDISMVQLVSLIDWP